MQPKNWLFALLLCFSSSFLSAQTSASSSMDTPLSLIDLDNKDWSFYLDEDSNTFYIDFESVQVNLSSIQMKDATGKVIYKDDVYDLPVNTIYEVDYSQFEKGSYEVELHSFTGVLHRKVSLK